MASTNQILRFTSLKTNSKSCRKLMVGFNESFPINHGPIFFSGDIPSFSAGGEGNLSKLSGKNSETPNNPKWSLFAFWHGLHKIRQLTFNRFFSLSGLFTSFSVLTGATTLSLASSYPLPSWSTWPGGWKSGWWLQRSPVPTWSTSFAVQKGRNQSQLKNYIFMSWCQLRKVYFFA